jgi:hypothetical protein
MEVNWDAMHAHPCSFEGILLSGESTQKLRGKGFHMHGFAYGELVFTKGLTVILSPSVTAVMAPCWSVR